jgi:hypothetical protein
MTTATLSPTNAILFVLDPSNETVQVPPYVDGVLTAASSTCVSIGTQAAVDGRTTVSLGRSQDGSDNSDLEKVFDGRLETPSRQIAIMTSELQKVLELPVGGTSTKVCIWTDSPRNPSRVTVLVE